MYFQIQEHTVGQGSAKKLVILFFLASIGRLRCGVRVCLGVHIGP